LTPDDQPRVIVIRVPKRHYINAELIVIISTCQNKPITHPRMREEIQPGVVMHLALHRLQVGWDSMY
jgi:hypothetical protein